jgi:hypothetical protein
MKTKYMTFNLLVAICILPFAILKAQVPNGGFENWTSGNPDNWYNSNLTGIGIPVTQYTPGHTGICAKGQPVFSAILNDTLPPLLMSGTTPGNGFPISQAYATLEFYYQCNLTNADLFSATVVMYDAGNSPIGGGNEDMAASASGWTHKSISIGYSNSNPPAYAQISFTLLPDASSSATQPSLSSTFLVDDVSLTGVAAVTEITGGNNFATVFPNPAKDAVAVSVNNSVNGIADVVVYDLLGNVVKKFSSAMTTTRYEQKFSVAGLPAGIYPVRITSGKKQWMGKIVKQ